MDYRGVLLFATVVASAGLATLSCSAPDPGAITFSERAGGGGGGGESSSGGTSGTTSGGTGGSSGTSGGGDGGGGGEGGAGGDPVFGGSQFAAGNPPGGPAKGKQQHQQINANLDPSGVNCMQCHAGTWAFGGTLYTAITGGAGRVAGAEIRVTGPDGKAYASAYSDADGNFWVQSVGAPIPANSKAGVRNAAGKVKIMSATVAGDGGRACNEAACHGADTNRMFLD
jgi:hypothetical protein